MIMFFVICNKIYLFYKDFDSNLEILIKKVHQKLKIIFNQSLNPNKIKLRNTFRNDFLKIN